MSFLQNGVNGTDIQEEFGTLLQQPLALGYFVSTAPTGRMPRWFWNSCSHLENVCPAFLKSALHMHTTQQQNSDELLQQSSISGHPLDSQYTTDVLRYLRVSFSLQFVEFFFFFVRVGFLKIIFVSDGLLLLHLLRV